MNLAAKWEYLIEVRTFTYEWWHRLYSKLWKAAENIKIVLKLSKYNRTNTYNKTKVNITKHLQKRATRIVQMKELRKRNKNRIQYTENLKSKLKRLLMKIQGRDNAEDTWRKKNAILIIANQKNPSVSIEVKINKNKCCFCWGDK